MKLKMKAHKVDNSYLITLLNRTPIFMRYVVWCGSKNKFQKFDMCLKELDHMLENLLTTLTLIIDIIEKPV